MTDRERLIKLFEEWDKQDEIDSLADYLLANGVIVQEWISVENRLPDVRENPVLVSYGGGVLMAWRHKEWWELPSGLNTNYVTHWMPLPKPPKEVQEKLKELKNNEPKT